MSEHIFIVEDNKDIAEILEYLFKDKGFKISIFPAAAFFNIAVKNK